MACDSRGCPFKTRFSKMRSPLVPTSHPTKATPLDPFEATFRIFRWSEWLCLLEGQRLFGHGVERESRHDPPPRALDGLRSMDLFAIQVEVPYD